MLYIRIKITNQIKSMSMIYFKTIYFQKDEKRVIEKAIRKFSLKRHSSLDLQSSSSYITEDGKYFLGQETEKYIRTTRFRTPFEKLLPKLILRFNKNDFESYQIRFSFPSNLIFLVLVIAILLNFFKFISSGRLGGNIGFVIVLSILFALLTLLEIKLISRKIKKAIDITKKVV